MTNATVLLTKGLNADNHIIEVRGTPFQRTGKTGVGDGIQALQQEKLLHAPTYLLGEGRVAAGQDAQAQGNIQFALQESVWSQWHDTYGETDTLLDANGICGSKGQLYVASFQQGGLFVHNPMRIQDAVLKKNGQHLTENNALSLNQQEVDAVLDAVKRKDTAALREIGFLRGGSQYIFEGFGQFKEMSARDDFLKDMPGYVVLRTSDQARQQPSGYQSIAGARDNENVAIVFGGVARSGAVLDVASKLGWTQFGSHHDGYQTPNGGRVVVVDNRDDGVGSSYGLDYLGRPVGVAPEALALRAKIVKPLEITVREGSVAQNVRTFPEKDVRRLFMEQIGYTRERADQLLGQLASYSTEKQ